MAVSLGPLSDPRAELTLTEINRELQLQLAKNKQDFRDLTEKFLVSQATAYSLANQLQKYKCEACKDIIESVLGEKLSFEALRLAEKLAEKPTLDERLRTCDILIRSQARELTQLRQTLREGKDDSVLLKQHLKDLVTHNDLDNHQGPGFREQLTEGHRLAERLARKLSPETDEDEEDEPAEETLTPSLELQEVAKEAVRQESQDECVLTPSRLPGSSDCSQPCRDGRFACDAWEVGPALDGACGCSHAAEDGMPTDLPDNQHDHVQVDGQEPVSPRVELQEVEKKEVLQESQDECVLAPSSVQEGANCYQPYSDGKCAFDEGKVGSALEGACGCSHAKEDKIPTGLPENQSDQDDLEGPEAIAPRLSGELLQMGENGVPRDSLDEYHLTYSVLPGRSDSFWPYRSTAIFSCEEVDVPYAPDVSKHHTVLEEEEDQDLICSRMELPVGEENEVQQDSLDECYLVGSIDHHLSDSCRPQRSASLQSDNREVFSAPDAHGDTWEDCLQGPVNFQGSEVQTSQAQLQKSTHETNDVQLQPDQHFGCGDSRATVSLSSIVWGFNTNTDSGNQGPLFPELGLDASIGMKTPPKLEGEGSAASKHKCLVCSKIHALSVLKQKIIRRKLLFSTWRLACRFPGLQA